MSKEDRIQLEVFLGRKLSLSVTEEEKGILEELVVDVMEDYNLYVELMQDPATVLVDRGVSTETASELIDGIQEIITLPTALMH